MKKRVKTIFGALSIAVMTLSACGTNSERQDLKDTGVNESEKENTTVSDSHKPVELTVAWVAEESGEYAGQMEIKEKFEEAYPYITIKPDTMQFDVQTFYTKAAAGQTPDLYWVSATEVQKIISGGYAADLTDYLSDEKYLEQMNETVLEQISKDGRVYSIPQSVYAMGLMYNASLFEKAGLLNEDGTPQIPETWEEMAEMAVKIKEATGKAGFIIPTIKNQGGWMFTPIAWSYGVEFMTQGEDGKWQAAFNTQECVDALQFIKDLKWKYDVMGANTLLDYSEAAKQLSIAGAAMTPMAPDVVDKLQANEMPLDNVGIMAMPAGPVKRVALSGGRYNMVSSGASEEQIEAAIKWIEFNGYGPDLTDTSRETIESFYKMQNENNIPVGIKPLVPYKESAEVTAFRYEMIDKYCNIIPEHVKPYNDAIVSADVKYQVEEPVYTQELYAILEKCIQEVLTNQNADCKKLISDACEEFQSAYLDQQ
ncbi:MAG: sugar ABC transporter substrate-binding protein [Eubacteriales bacterium]|nr:sugar ABC transporter substrate-binding protein [Eubacteriales bacterium]